MYEMGATVHEVGARFGCSSSGQVGTAREYAATRRPIALAVHASRTERKAV